MIVFLFLCIVFTYLTVSKTSQSEVLCEEKNAQLLERLERLERIFNISQYNPDLDDISILELFYENAKRSFISSIPSTDADCSFNWKIGKCYPPCKCSFQFKIGDYLPSRSCRITPESVLNPNCKEEEENVPWVLHIVNATKNLVTKVGRTIKDRAPPTDSECAWNWRSLRCEPYSSCELEYQFGDYSLDRTCRMIQLHGEEFHFEEELDEDDLKEPGYPKFETDDEIVGDEK